MRSCVFLFIVLLFIACRDEPTAVALMPEIKDTDSVEILYFKQPGNQRFYTYIPSTDKDFINTLITDLDKKSETEKDENTCVKEGKIYMHRNGSIFNTVFFSYADNSCKFLRFIKNGKLYYFPISDKLRQKLTEFRLLAKEPVANAQ
jgi:hypothetical protein